MPALSLCVMVWIDSLHTQCQGHHQGLMNERWKGTEVEQWRKREISPPHPPTPHHTCKRLIRLLHYQASAAGTGFNSSSRYHWATKMVNLDYLLYLLPNPQYYKYLSCSATWKSNPVQRVGQVAHSSSIISVSWWGGGVERPGDQRGGMFTLWDTSGMKDIQRSGFGIRFMTMACCKCFVLDVSPAPAND